MQKQVATALFLITVGGGAVASSIHEWNVFAESEEVRFSVKLDTFKTTVDKSGVEEASVLVQSLSKKTSIIEVSKMVLNPSDCTAEYGTIKIIDVGSGYTSKQSFAFGVNNPSSLAAQIICWTYDFYNKEQSETVSPGVRQ